MMSGYATYAAWGVGQTDHPLTTGSLAPTDHEARSVRATDLGKGRHMHEDEDNDPTLRELRELAARREAEATLRRHAAIVTAAVEGALNDDPTCSIIDLAEISIDDCGSATVTASITVAKVLLLESLGEGWEAEAILRLWPPGHAEG